MQVRKLCCFYRDLILGFESSLTGTFLDYISVLCSTLYFSFCICLFRPKVKSAASIVLRGANDFMLDEMERSLHDSLCAVKRVMESKTVVAGGGAVEAALSIYLENFATSLVSVCEEICSAALYSPFGFNVSRLAD